MTSAAPEALWICRGATIGRSLGGPDPHAAAWTGFGTVSADGEVPQAQQDLLATLGVAEPRLDGWAIYPRAAFAGRLATALDRFAAATGRALPMPDAPGDGCGIIVFRGGGFAMSIFAGQALRAAMGRYLDMILPTGKPRFSLRFRFDGFLAAGQPDSTDGRFAVDAFKAGRPWVSRPGDRVQLTITPGG